MCMCIEFQIQVSKLKNAHVSFPAEVAISVAVLHSVLELSTICTLTFRIIDESSLSAGFGKIGFQMQCNACLMS